MLLLCSGVGLLLFAHWLAVPSPVDVIVVYAGNPARVIHGVDLYRQGLAPRIWHTGAAVQQEAVLALLRQGGVPAEAMAYLVTETTWQDSRATLTHAADHSLSRVLVVTDWWHGRRALCTLQQQMPPGMLDVAFSAVPDAPFDAATWWRHRCYFAPFR